MTDETLPSDSPDPMDPIAQAWAEQEEFESVVSLSSDPTALADSLEAAHLKDQMRLLWLNIREVSAAMTVATVWIILAVVDASRPWALVIAALLMVFLSCFLGVSSIRHYQADQNWDDSVREQLARRLAQLSHRAELHRTMAWWYLLPIALSMVFAGYGLDVDYGSSFGLGYLGVVFAGCVIGEQFNRHYFRKRFDSEIKRLEPLLADFDETA